jgi:ketosteroid isomerase-like protein
MTAVSGSAAVVERFLAAMQAHDWDAMGACVTDDVVRVGPYGDEYRGRADYVAFIAALLPTLPGYAMDVARVVAAGDIVTAQLAETVDVDGSPVRTPEALVFEVDDSGRIARIEVFTQAGSRL